MSHALIQILDNRNVSPLFSWFPHVKKKFLCQNFIFFLSFSAYFWYFILIHADFPHFCLWPHTLLEEDFIVSLRNCIESCCMISDTFFSAIYFLWPYSEAYNKEHLLYQQVQAHILGGGGMHHPKSSKRSTFSHIVGQKWGVCRRVKGVRFQKSTFWIQKVHILGVLHPSSKLILAMGLTYNAHKSRDKFSLTSTVYCCIAIWDPI